MDIRTPRPIRAGLAVIASIVLAVAGAGAGASDRADRVRAAVPDGVTLTQVEERGDALRLTGHAASNAEVAALMRALDDAGLGTPRLQAVQRVDGLSQFVLDLEAKPAAP